MIFFNRRLYDWAILPANPFSEIKRARDIFMLDLLIPLFRVEDPSRTRNADIYISKSLKLEIEIRWQQMTTDYNRWHQMTKDDLTPDDIIWHQMTTDDKKWQQMTTDYNRWHQMTSYDIRWHQMTSDCIRWHQMISKYIKFASSEFVQELLEYIGILRYWAIGILDR